MEVLARTTNVRYEEQYSEDFNTEYNVIDYPEEVAMIENLSKRLEEELREAKREHLSAGEVLLPTGLTSRIARHMFALADSEPCGLRGCTLYIDFEGKEIKQKLSSIKCDPTTPSTFELYLTLRQGAASWNTYLPQFLKKMTRGGTVTISTEYNLQKRKLYRSSI